jgi:gas vesicle protein
MSHEIHDSKSEGVNGFAWFLTGVVLGAAAAILYAPKTGRDTREFVTQQTRRGKEAVTETTESIVDSGRDMFDRGRKLVEEAAALFERGRKLVQG